MRLLMLSTDSLSVPPSHYGGIERVVAEVARELARRGNEVALLAKEGSSLEGVECIAWQERPLVPTAAARGIQALCTARAFGADLIHSFGQTKWLLPWCAVGGRAIASFGALPQRRVRHLVRPFRSRLRLAGCSNYIARAGADLVGGKWTTVYNCVDVNRYRFEAAVPADAPLVFLSRLDANKGVDLAIEISRRAGRRLIIAGNRGHAGESGRYWREVVEPQLKETHVEYVGEVDDAQKDMLLGQAAGLVVPIRWDEPFGMVFIEALACGTPILSFARGALPEIVRDGIEGFLGQTVDELVTAAAHVGEIDRRNCRRRVENCFSVGRTVDDYERQYQELLGTFSACPGS
jgi:glycosyltransferase involved in cell wall biosynthesis